MYHDDFEEDLYSLRLDNLRKKYPDTVFTVAEESVLEIPSLPDDHIWCCDSGKGEVTPIIATVGHAYRVLHGAEIPDICHVELGVVSPNRDPNGEYYPVYQYKDTP